MGQNMLFLPNGPNKQGRCRFSRIRILPPGRGKRRPAEDLCDRSFCWARKSLQCPAVHRVKGFSRPFFERRPMAPLETQSLQKLLISVQQPCDESYITMTASSISGETLTKPLNDLPIYSRCVAVAARDENKMCRSRGAGQTTICGLCPEKEQQNAMCRWKGQSLERRMDG